MAHAFSTSSVFRIGVFVALMISSCILWFVQASNAGGEVGGWLLFGSIVLLFVWSFVLYRRERTLAWLCWLTVVATFLVSLWLR
jgi:hypothetical protein